MTVQPKSINGFLKAMLAMTKLNSLILLPLGSDDDIISEIKRTNISLKLEKFMHVLFGYCRHSWNIEIQLSKTMWHYVSFRTLKPDLDVFRFKMADSIVCEKCGKKLLASEIEDVETAFLRKYRWQTRVYFESSYKME